MFIFLFAGVFLLFALNPPYTATLVSRAVPGERSLSLSPPSWRHMISTSLLAQSPWNTTYPSSQPLLPSVSHCTNHSALAPVPGISKVSVSPVSPATLLEPTFETLSALVPRELVIFKVDSFFSGVPLDTAAAIMGLLALRYGCSRLVRKLRVRQPSSPEIDAMKASVLFFMRLQMC